MRSLTVHLREAEAHDRLPFHPGCPICRETRASGRVAPGALLSPRAPALLAASLLAVSSAAPAAVALGAEQDQQQDGTAPVTQSAPSDSSQDPNFDPGGDSTDLPDTAPDLPQTPAPSDPGDDDAGPVDQVSASNPDDPVVDPGDGSDPTPTGTPPAAAGSPAPVASPETTPTPSPTAAAGEPTPAATPEAAAPSPATESPGTPSSSPRSPKRADHHTLQRQPDTPEKPALAAPSPAPSVVTTASAPPAPAETTAPTVTGHRAQPGDRTHVVLPGESLWSVASDLLGRPATPGTIAREVHLLWQLNRERIGTGDPDLLLVGTRLVLQ